MKKRLDWREVGGAPLVGVNGVGFISHGRSDAVAIENAIRRASDAARTHFVDENAPAVAPAEALRRGRRRRRPRRETVPPPAPRLVARRLIREEEMRSFIAGTGSYVPEKVLSNRELEKMVETSDEWIVERTGIRERRVAAPEEASSDLAVKASIRALEMAALDPKDVEAIVVGTITPDYPFPSAGAVLQGRLGNKKAFAFDVSAACAGSLYALAVADRFVASGAVKNALVVGVDTLTRLTDWNDRNTCILFGDGACDGARPSDDRGAGPHDAPPHRRLARPDPVPAGGGSRDPISRRSSARSRTT
jgi:hypothetical protein